MNMLPNLTRSSVENVAVKREILSHVSPSRCCDITTVPCWCPIRTEHTPKLGGRQRIGIVEVLKRGLVWYVRCSRREYRYPALSFQSEMSDRRGKTLYAAV